MNKLIPLIPSKITRALYQGDNKYDIPELSTAIVGLEFDGLVWGKKLAAPVLATGTAIGSMLFGV